LNQNNIPIPLTSLVGRQKDVEEIGQVLSSTRLMTLLGPGGVGKTRLAIEAAYAAAGKFDNGVCWADLASLIDPSLIPQTIAKARELYLAPDQTPLEGIENYLKSKQVLLVLDNCEHLIAACAELVEHLLNVCPNLQVLTASREQFGIFGEVTWQVPSLPIPDLHPLPPFESLLEYPSIRLFLERAAAVSPGYTLTELNAQPIALICQKLDGLPLAIELAAARIKLLSAKEIASRLDDRFELLTGGSRNALPRQQTLRATLDWSYELLTETEQRLFRCLSVFPDCFSLGAAEQVSRSNSVIPEIINFLDLLLQLVNKSLIKVESEVPASESETRYQMQETIREYAHEKLVAAGESVAVHSTYVNYYLWLVKDGEPKLYNQEQSAWIDQLEVEYDNLRAAIEWSLEYQDIESAAQLVMYLGRFWQLRGYYCEAAMWLERILAMQSMADQTRAKLLLSRSLVTQVQGDYENAAAMVEDSLKIFITLGDISGIAEVKAVMGIIRVFQGEREKGIELLEESRKTFQESGDEWQTARVLLYISDSYNRMGNNKTAVPLCQECLAIFTKLGDPWGIAFASGIAGEIARKEGDLLQAKEYFRNNLVFHWQHGQKGEIPYPLETLALIAVSEKKFDRAVCLWGAAEVFREQANVPLPPAYQTDYHKSLAVAHEKLGEKAYIAALEQGRSLPPADVIDLATYDDIVFPQIASTMAEEAVAEIRLTKRELEILRLVATGMTDAQVAEMLFLSPRTISKHLESIYSKLQVNSRTAASHYALSHKLFEINL
jgi:predicted ATPase/DNA-binding CsgD family transcriptional regulator